MIASGTERRYAEARPWSDAAFLRYMTAHNKVPGAMFDPPQIERLWRLAGWAGPAVTRAAEYGYVYADRATVAAAIAAAKEKA